MKILIIIIALIVPHGFGAKILAFFPSLVPSHHFFFQPILRALAERGHHIDYYTPFSMKAPHASVTEIIFEDFYRQTGAEFSYVEHWRLSLIEQLADLSKLGIALETMLCQTKTLHQLLSSNTTYDLIIHEGVFGAETSNVLKHKFNAHSVTLLSIGDMFHLNELSGLINNPAYMVNAFTDYTESMSFFERLHNMYQLIRWQYLYFSYLKEVQTVHERFLVYPGLESRPSLASLMSDQSLILVNSHHSIGYAFPKPPHVKEIGGSILSPNKPLPPNVLEFIKEAEHGVIYLSMGTRPVLETSSTNAKEIFSRAFSRRKERILWKSNDAPWDDLPPNVMLSKWFPQQDILAHKNIKLFITHGGVQSYFETVTFGVPVIVIPSFADQIRNSLAIAHHGYGVRLTFDNLTETSLAWAFDEVLGQPKYKQNILKGSTILKDRPANPVDEGVYWIEYVLRHGNVLQPEGARLGFIQLHCIDLYTFILAAILAILYLVKYVLSWLLSLFKIVEINLDVGWKKHQ